MTGTVRLIVLLAAGAICSASAYAAPSGHSTIYGDWVVECRISGPAQACSMTQHVIDGRAQMQLVRFEITGNRPAQVKLLVPLGVWLDPGVAVRFGAQQDKTFAFTYAKCLPDGCLADGPLTPELLAALQSAQQGTVLIADRNRKFVSVPFSGKGFGEALAALKSESQPKPADWLAQMQAQFQKMQAEIQKMIAGKS